MRDTNLTIAELGHRGDGIAHSEGGQVYVPGALPGEEVTAEVSNGRAADVTYIKTSPDRIEPICKHYESCGGCSVQHLAQKPYLDWKRGLVVKALADRGIEAEVAPVVPSEPGSRRRAVLTAARAGRTILLGYHEKASHKMVDISECPVLVPEIVAGLRGLKRLCVELMPKKGELRLNVLSTTNGLDVAFDQADRKYESRFAALSQLAVELGLARLTINGETLLEARPPALDMGGLTVVPPPAGFTQATLQAEAALCDLVLEGLGKSKKVTDLFAGVGTFALRIAKSASVHAVEGDAAANKALDKALRVPRGLKKVTFERRDLFRRPLMKAELASYDAVVFDPPRAGAQAQAEQIAASKVKTVIAVSCNPATLARDLRILIDGGYTLQKVTPVDQFLFSPHIECVAILKRE
ncbi:class I SAM-dependent RNA methyltransferase [Roseibium polysiphoniae]|uniref:Class I SAM-dependent RNA methyltransferase n=1 Tax=Roseibium polysiphoniae TaxID=2571221 RepID=A0A944CDQ7_9HYPH|nr:class I SAM-dependent RNA methyltransferase [Roseibium polysiphoniae]MBS8261239.1 class I SAM-dependent RNA methyltransferase [Roseibium polysiphoniae]